MEFPDLIKNLTKHPAFLDWKHTHSHCYLAHVFVMLNKDSCEGYQVGYYDTHTDRITSFLVKNIEHTISVTELAPSEVFREPDTKIPELEVHGIDLSVTDALAIAHDTREEDYRDVPVTTTFFTLQNINDLGTVFNITFITQDLCTLNVKIDARSGEVLHHSMDRLVTNV